MRAGAWVLAASLIVSGALAGGVAAGSGAQAAEPRDFVLVPHQNGTLALRTSEILSVWYREGSPSQLRIVSPALAEAKSLEGDQADALWQRLHDGPLASSFVFVSHLKGTLGIPRAGIRTAYYAEDGGQPTLRLQYTGEASGKTIAGEEAARIWKTLAEQARGRRARARRAGAEVDRVQPRAAEPAAQRRRARRARSGIAPIFSGVSSSQRIPGALRRAPAPARHVITRSGVATRSSRKSCAVTGISPVGRT